MKFSGVTLILITGLSIAANPAFLIVPSESVGVIQLGISREELSDILREEILVDTLIHLGEGYMTAGTLIFPGTSKELKIVWDNSDMNSIEEITVTGAIFETIEGIHVGMSLTDVNLILGEFNLLGFAWDYEGRSDFSNTLLGSGISAAFDAGALDTEEKIEAWESVQGDEWFSSIDPGMIDLDPVIESISVHRPHE
ncbi:MAG: hypothetical protein KAQ97_00510 [Candidatus Fermentibacteraceae bacterium]|nr:hypothetical protein [Candidatus Fermentibacteraceae bacterium]